MMGKSVVFTMVMLIASWSNAHATEHYVIDTKGMHAFIAFKVKHLGYSWLEGHFNRFTGSFDFDRENSANNKVRVEIDVASIDSNHAERDKHLRSERYFDTGKFPKASFVSTSWTDLGNAQAILKGKFTLRGITKSIAIEVKEIGHGADPWGGYRRGFEGKTELKLSDYHMRESQILGHAAENIRIWISVEGIREAQIPKILD